MHPAIDEILKTRQRIAAHRCALIAISGIDASGKGYLAAQIAGQLRARGARIALINIDGWLNLPHVRFSEANPAAHFYDHAIRFDDMFTQLIFPLRERRSLRIEMDFTEENATSYRPKVCRFEDIDIILLEGIYLLKRTYQAYYDASFWIDCSFETALERAIGRAQEGLSPQETVKAYRTIYFPAQEIHLSKDHPRAAAGMVINNDPRLPALPVL